MSISLSCYLTASSQTTIKPTIGVNMSDFSKDEYGEAKAKAGWQIGGSIAFGKKVYIEPGLFWVGKTTELTAASTDDPDLTIDMKGIRIPLAVGVNLLGSEATMFGLRGFGGASAFFVTSNKGVPEDIALNKANFGVFAGAGIDIWKIFIDASYEWSVSNIQKDVNQVDLGKTRSIFINAGIRINL